MAESTPPNSTPTVAVVGGGITGLAAAYRLVERAGRHNRSVHVRLLEAHPRLGGTIHTERRDGFLLEHGPDSFITQKPGGLDLCRRLGITDRLIGTGEQFRRTFIVGRGKLHPLPEGFMLLAPSRFWPFVTSRLFSWPGKLRMALDLFLPRLKNPPNDESLASFVTRRLGKEALQRVAQPLIGGIYAADPSNLSLRATMPRFLEMEARHRSLIKAMWRQRSAMAQSRGDDSGVRYSMFVSLTDGMRSLVDELASRLPPDTVRLDTPIASADWNQAENAWHLTCSDGATIRAQGLILTLPGYQAAKIVRDFDPDLAGELDAIEYASSATINLAYRQVDVPHPLDGFGFVVPAVEVRSIIACTFCHRKFSGRAPDGHVLMRVFAGGALHPHHLDRDDRDMILAARRDLAELVGVRAEPLFASVWRHVRSMPQYPVGHLDRVRRIQEKARKHPHLHIAGNVMGGVGIPDCAASAQTTADAVFDELTA